MHQTRESPDSDSTECAPYSMLTWDSGFFGFKVARINKTDDSNPPISKWVQGLGSKGISLIYWPSLHKFDSTKVAQNNGRLVDEKTTFMTHPVDCAHPPDPDVIPYHPSMPSSDFNVLAIQSGEQSRFAVDPKIPRAKFEELYTTWIKKSLNNTIASETLAICDNFHPVGMITLSLKENSGEIGLVAVKDGYRGRHYGTRLVFSALHWFKQRDCSTVRVVTQKHNLAACRLYAQCGFTIESIYYYYHFWPQSTAQQQPHNTTSIV